MENPSKNPFPSMDMSTSIVLLATEDRNRNCIVARSAIMNHICCEGICIVKTSRRSGTAVALYLLFPRGVGQAPRRHSSDVDRGRDRRATRHQREPVATGGGRYSPAHLSPAQPLCGRDPATA